MSTPIQNPANIESWEQRVRQIQEERAEEFARLSPEEKQKILAEEKLIFQREQEKLRTEMGYGKFDPAKRRLSTEQNPPEEIISGEAELAAMEAKLQKTSPLESAESPEQADLKRFFTLYDAAMENISQQKPFEFDSVALDDFGRMVKQKAYMRELFDHSQHANLEPAKIRERLKSGQTKPEQISLTVEVDMGEEANNPLGLTNLRLKLSLASLIEGHFTEKMSRFTNLVLYAAAMHARQKLPVNDQSPQQEPSTQAEIDPVIKKETDKFAITRLGQNGGLQGGDGAFEMGAVTPVAFSFNNGSVWGTFESHGAPGNPKELQESLDKTSKEQ